MSDYDDEVLEDITGTVILSFLQLLFYAVLYILDFFVVIRTFQTKNEIEIIKIRLNEIERKNLRR